MGNSRTLLCSRSSPNQQRRCGRPIWVVLYAVVIVLCYTITRRYNYTCMRVITFVTQKGGSGKTTLVLSCAAAAAELGSRVLVLDMDPQKTAEAWYQAREAPTPKLASVTPAELPTAIMGGRERFDVILIDTPGRDEPSTATAIRHADLCLIPCRPTPADMKATPPTVATINRLGKVSAFVLNQTPPRGYRIHEAARGLSVLGMVAPVHVVARSAFQDAHGMGLTVTESEPDGKAAGEIRELWRWIAQKLEKVNDDEKTHVS